MAHDTWVGLLCRDCLNAGTTSPSFPEGPPDPNGGSRFSRFRGDREDRADLAAKLKGKSFDAVIDTQAYGKEDVESAVGAFNGNVGRYVIVSTGSVYLEGAVDFSEHCTFQESVVDWSSIRFYLPRRRRPIRCRQTPLRKVAPREQRGSVHYRPYSGGHGLGRSDRTDVVVDPTGTGRTRRGYPAGKPWTISHPYTLLMPRRLSSVFLMCRKPANQTYHIAMQEIMTIERWAELIWKAAGHEHQIAYVPNEINPKTGPPERLRPGR